MEKVSREIECNSYMLFGKNGMQPVQRIVGSLPRGMKVVYSFYAGNEALYGALGDGRLVLISDVVDDCFDDEMFGWASYKNDKEAQPIEEKFGIGVYYCENEEPFTEEELQNAIMNAEIREKNRTKYEEDCKRASYEKTERLKKEYSYLTQVTRETKTRDITNNVRKVLKNKFPGVKFSVRYDSFSGGDSIHVEYTDGPVEEEVDSVISMFCDSHRDITGDYWDYDPSEFNRLFGGFKFTRTERDYSDETINNFEEILKKDIPSLSNANQQEWFFNDEQVYNDAKKEAYSSEEIPESVRNYILCKGNCWHIYTQLARVWASKEDMTIKHTEIEEKHSTDDKNGQINGDFTIIEYSEKAIAVVGDTKIIKDQLKELGGKFNPRLSCGAGWIFSKKKENELKELLNK